MDLHIENSLLNNIKENKIVQKFIEELSNYLENLNNNIKQENTKDLILKKEDCLYQVVEKTSTGAYIENLTTHHVAEEKDLTEEIYNKITNDSVLKYKNGNYIYEEELTKDFLNNLVGIDEYEGIHDDFINKYDLSKNDSNTIYEVQSITEDNYILSYIKNGQKNMLEVPKKLIPYWTKIGDNLNYENDEFCIK